MKKSLSTQLTLLLVFVLSLSFLSACSDDDGDNTNGNVLNQTLTESDINALLFMLEEEKLARDTYRYLNNEWYLNQFANIKNSEQAHMDAVENLLIQYDIEYTILPEGVFANQTLQNYYNQFILDGSLSQANALQIGATIEDLDIVDLRDHLEATTNSDLISVFNSLQCGSKNHLRSFVFGIENTGNTYLPQFLSLEEYNAIINGSHEQCF
ncbi:DUF2202 domain-containing protein [Winogradskyella sp. SYSU M77433]|uniref:DUF2202 domain-containing protein n=1 Tax=Winogradskyella sp. SYSU M77433 TaxID=3042722 RepID=UPI002480BE79|nr:DUF2202 domain-containing protein [Winogradskyella sp. SYSU M77433]MDH7912757.1 DUF2202 domain-containing protein [Winogradskyella sp. SYSU M77433]